MNNKSQDYLLYLIKGFAAGAANMIPGVSGASVAVVTGTYEEVVESICKVNRDSFKTLLSGGIASFWRMINGNFMLVMTFGIAISFFSLNQFFNDFSKSQPVLLYSFLCGIVLASAFCVLKRVTRWDIVNITALVAGIAFSLVLFSFSPAGTHMNVLVVFVVGLTLSMSIFVPGLTTSYTLFLFVNEGGFKSFLSGDNVYLLVLSLGIIVGLLLTPRAIRWFLDKARNISYAFIAGCIIGGLKMVWPWKTLVTHQASKLSFITEQTFSRNILPSQYQAVNNHAPDVLLSLLLVAAGAGVIFVIRKVAND